MTDNVDDFLMHHGVKGMKWGVIREDKTSNNNSPSKTTEITKKKGESRFSPNQKAVMIGAGVAVGLLAAYGAYKFHDSGAMSQALNRGREFMTGQQFAFKRNDALSHNMSGHDILNKVVKPINPNYGAYGTKLNCKRTAFAYELRRRGYDVKATISNSGIGQDVVGRYNATTKGSSVGNTKMGRLLAVAREDSNNEKFGTGTPLLNYIKSAGRGENTIDLNGTSANPMAGLLKNNPLLRKMGGDDFVDESTGARIAKTIGFHQPDGARGELAVGWKGGGGHSMAWEIIHGTVHIFDTQSGEMFDTPEKMNSWANGVSDAAFTRLDNKDLNMEFLQRWAKNA
jgi:hypothetical protein